ncbi:f66acd5a-1cce-4a68-a21d-c5979b195bff [Thermothielavioides terrestris]|jgi:hypothetical protein
MIQ